MFLEDVKVTIEAPTATGTTTIDSAAYDTSGYGGTVFIVRLGSPAANNNIRVQEDSAVGMGAAADLANTLVNDAVKNQHMVEIVRPLKQFLRCRVTRGTTTTIDSIIVIQYNARKHPVTQPTSVQELYVSPAEGAA